MILEILSIALIVSGVFFLAVGTLGLLRFPDFYTRMHATGKCDTLGAVLLLTGLAIYNGLGLVSVKILFIMVIIFLANPTATHAIARAALINRVEPWLKEVSPAAEGPKAEERPR